GQRDGGGAVVHEHDVVGGQSEFVSAAGGVAVDGGDVPLRRVGAGVFDGVARLVRELAEVDVESVRGLGEHPDVGAGAEHPVQGRADHHRSHFRVLKAQALHGVGQFDV